jgi:hypothetical protein
MGLPIQKAPKHRCKLSDGSEVTFRPFLVKEQKYLLLAKEANSASDVLDATKDLIMSVTDNKVNINNMPMYDLEYLFLKIRCKSIGESQNITFRCRGRDCKATHEEMVELDKIEIQFPNGKVDNTVQLTEEMGVTLRYPNARQLVEADAIELEGDRLVYLLKHGIHTIFDAESVYDTDDIQDAELTEFVESLSMPQVEKLNGFFENIPTLRHTVEWDCSVCSNANKATLEGLQSFF